MYSSAKKKSQLYYDRSRTVFTNGETAKGASIVSDAPFAYGKTDVGILDYILRALYDRECDGFAMTLIERFGSFGGVFAATREELMSVGGMTDRAASFFAFARPLFRQAVLRSTVAKPKVDCECALAMYAIALSAAAQKRRDYCLLSDASSRVFRASPISEDGVRSIVGGVCRSGAKKAVWLCCKPTSGGVSPDAERVREIARAIRALSVVDVEFVEYAEYSPSGFFFLRRAISGESNPTRMAAVRDDEYAPVSPYFVTRVEEYADRLTARKRRLFLK
ncbi:MAG: hypothetical protein NC184_02170 [Roseburia sp.]|nr:hypothetical protein [Roseburia sp.]